MNAQAELPLQSQEELPIPPMAWPRLARTLRHPRQLDVCQACGVRAVFDGSAEMRRLGTVGVERTAEGDRVPAFPRWIEHDAQYRPEAVVVVLCDPCAKRIIEPHPRLYDRLAPYQPMPGAMGICAGCVHNRSLVCRSQLAKFNGGPGLQIDAPEPGMMHVWGRGRDGRRTGGWTRSVPGPAKACSGREVAP